MNKSGRTTYIFLIIGLLVISIQETVYAYGGPGSIVSGIGTFLAVVGAILAAIFGFLWFPIKRLFASSEKEEESTGVEPAKEENSQSSE